MNKDTQMSSTKGQRELRRRTDNGQMNKDTQMSSTKHYTEN